MLLSRCFRRCGGKRLAGIKGLHDKQITDLSLTELKHFLVWCKSNLKTTPVIIGGWAVYAYVPKIGSIDIDVVLKKGELKNISKFFIKNNYTKREDEPNIYLKEAKMSSDKTETIRFDIIDYDKEYAITRAPEVKISVKLVGKHSQELKFEGQIITVPEKELLLIFKVAAYRNREDLARTGQLRLPSGQREWNERKIAKDKEDIRNLVESGVDYDRLMNFLKKLGFEDIYENSLKELGIID